MSHVVGAVLNGVGHGDSSMLGSWRGSTIAAMMRLKRWPDFTGLPARPRAGGVQAWWQGWWVVSLFDTWLNSAVQSLQRALEVVIIAGGVTYALALGSAAACAHSGFPL
jgi:hypothetical protein